MLPRPLTNALYGLYATHVLHMADRHGVFAHLAAGPATAAETAAALGLDPDTLERLLLVLEAFELVERDDRDRYGLPVELAPYLDRGGDRHIGAMSAHMVNGAAAQLGRLDAYLTRGKAAVDADLPAPFDVIYATPESTREFLDAMWQIGFDVSAELVRLADLGGVRHLVDVGGASGAFCVSALRAHPGLAATVYDLPQVGPYLAERTEEYGLAGRLEFAPGDFFRAAELPEADCLAFGYILSDWTDDTCRELLAKAHRACADGGRVLVMERLFDEGRRGPLATSVMNLSMHVETEGRHRTAGEYADLLSEAGFGDCRVLRSSQDKHLVVGYKTRP
ncbi:methyltransferase [Nocardiopsis potens]